MAAIGRAKTVHFAKIRQIDALWRDSFWLLVMRFVNLGAMLLLSVLLSRSLGAEQYGVFAFGIAVLMIAVVPARFGFDQYLASEIPALSSAGRFGEIRGLVRRAFQTTVVVSLGLLALWLVFWTLAPGLLSRPLWTSGAIALAALPCFALLHTRYGVLRGQHRPVAGQLPILVLQPLLAIALAALALLLAPAAIDGVAAQLLFAASIGLVCLLAFTALHNVTDETWREAATAYATRNWLRGAAPMMAAGGFSILIAHAGVLLLGALLDEAAAGLYQPAAQLAGFVMLTFHMVNQPLGPRIAQLYAENRQEELQQLVTRVAIICTVASLVVALCFFFWGETALSVYGEEFAAAAPALWILSAGSLATVALGPAAMILMMLGHGYLVAMLTAGGAALTILTTVALIPLLGVEGAAVANGGALLAWNVVAACLVTRRTGLYSSPLMRVVPVSFLRPEPA